MQVDRAGQATNISIKGAATPTRHRVSYLLIPQTFGVAIACLVTLGGLLPFLISSAYAVVGAQAIATAQNSSDQAARAIRYLEQARRWNPSDLNLYRQLAQAYGLNHQPEAVVATLEQAYRLEPDSLLIQQELALAYHVNGDIEQADALWRMAGVTSDQMVAVGDEALRQSDYAEARAWYNRALHLYPDIQSELGLRRFLAAHLLGLPDAEALLEKALNDHLLEVYPLSNAVTISGAQLRWMRLFERMDGLPFTFGLPLTFGVGGDTIGYLWWSGEAFAVVSVEYAGEYDLSMHVQQSDPPPVIMGIGVNGQEIQRVSLERGDDTWETITTSIYLDPGIHTIHVSFLNNAIIDAKDRNAVIAWVEIEEVSK